MSSEILEKVASAGIDGIKRIELKRTFGKNCDDLLQSLIERESVFVEKKGNTYFVWTKNNYVSYLTQNNPKFKLLLSNIPKQCAESKNHVENMETLIKNTNQNSDNYNHFKMEFDKCLNESATSIGWASFAQIRQKICESQSLSKEHFYTLASGLVEKHRENYEISSGGQEGVIMRGLVHGFVRNI
ncbi:MAG TPA: hypothetical protein VLB45_05830 [Nitrosopumilaceae archaeon]|nr:hypothetical protein [Nitrosopumilaceae archaeon]